MTSRKLEGVAQTLVAEGKGILAADETVPILTRQKLRSLEPSQHSRSENASSGESVGGRARRMQMMWPQV